MEHFFPRIQVETCAQMHTRVKIIEGDADEDHTQIIGEIYPPFPPGFRHPCQEPYAIGQQQSMLRSTTTKTNFNFQIYENF